MAIQRFDKQQCTEEMVIGTGRGFNDLQFVGCTFKRCRLVQQDDPRLGLQVRNVQMQRCRSVASLVSGVHFTDVDVDGLAVSLSLDLNACFLERVRLRGKIGPLVIAPPHPSWPHGIREAFQDEITARYATIDWALDISEAEFSSVDLQYVPGHLVRRDEETQFLLRKERFDGVDPSRLPLYGAIFASRFEVTPFDSLVVSAPRRSKRFREYMEEFEQLRSMGLAE